MPTVDLIIPAFNEEGILRKNVELLLSHLEKARYPFLWTIVLVINGSNDASENIARALQKEKGEKVRTLVLEKGGKGNAIKEAALISHADAALFMDVDLAVSPDHIGEALSLVLAGKSDLVIASRLLPASRTERSAIRTFISWSYNLLSRIILGHNLSDLQCGFKAGTRAAFHTILPRVKDERWFFDTELVTLALRSGLRVTEIPVSWLENRYAERKSKVRFFRDSVRFFRSLLALRLRLLKERL